MSVDVSSNVKAKEKSAASRQDIYAGAYCMVHGAVTCSRCYRCTVMLLATGIIAILLYCVVTEQLAAVPELNKLGPLFKSSNLPLELTESETEYNVRCVKHTFAHHMVFQVMAPCWNNARYKRRDIAKVEYKFIRTGI